MPELFKIMLYMFFHQFILIVCGCFLLIHIKIVSGRLSHKIFFYIDYFHVELFLLSCHEYSVLQIVILFSYYLE